MIDSTSSLLDFRPSPQRGQVFFIRHGESTSNERNIFAGVLDVELTAFGKMQAQQAGQDLKRKDIKFDAVYVSHLKRARQTCDIALVTSEALRSTTVTPQIDHRIGEKSFGIFAQRNKNLLRLALGYEGFETMLHSHSETPPSGERIELVYQRAAHFYEEKVAPHLNRGENVLVVCHQYVLEPLALYLSGLPPTAYRHLKLPNGKALSQDELVKFQHKESGGSASLRKKLNDLAIMWGVIASACAFLGGSVMKASGLVADLSSPVFTSVIVACLAISTFYAYLDIDFAASKQNVSQVVKSSIQGWMLARWGIALILLFSGLVYQGSEDLYKVLWLMFWLVPPALTTPVLSILWGGNLYPAALLSRSLSIIIPAALIGLLSVVMLPISPFDLGFFYIILGLGLALPAMLAQLWRSNYPVESNHHSKNWKCIGILAASLMAFVTGLQFTPSDLFVDIFIAANPERSIACLQQLGVALTTFLLMRVLAILTILASSRWPNPAESQDAYILLVTPNFFLWAALFSSIRLAMPQDVLTYAIFWGAFGFFCIPPLEQVVFTMLFSNTLLKDALRSSRVTVEEAKHLFQQFDRDHNNALDRRELLELIRLIEYKTTGQLNVEEESHSYLLEHFFKTLDSNQDNLVSIQEFEHYLARYGLVINLNSSDSTYRIQH